MAYQATFKRYEIKYLLTEQQRDLLLRVMEPYMAQDKYGRTTIRNLYFDTDHYRLIRHSLEKPVYKEKLRIRSYCKAREDSTVFVELKKKYKGVVYKRRLSLPEREAMEWLDGGSFPGAATQISREIDYVLRCYGKLTPKVYLSYERVAWFCRQGGDFRITLDENILCRRCRLTLGGDNEGIPILPEGMVLLEVKTAGGMPLWLSAFLNREKIYKTSFSKYGTAYQRLILPNYKGECLHA